MKKLFFLMTLTGLILTGCKNFDCCIPSDTTPPTVTMVKPTGAAISGILTITFSKAMNTTPGTVKLNDLAPLTGGTWSAGNTVLTLTYGVLPDVLPYSTTFTVNIYGFTDVAGNIMDDDNSNSFTTRANICRYCNGVGTRPCVVCSGTGTKPDLTECTTGTFNGTYWESECLFCDDTGLGDVLHTWVPCLGSGNHGHSYFSDPIPPHHKCLTHLGDYGPCDDTVDNGICDDCGQFL
ncbi:MAG: Ig-like domain-containing protein [Bacteroidales bacterium]|nr:Ig-like domain-containing protein [Bacteroidales bacterium]